MKQPLLLSILLLSASGFAQMQIGNSDLELWETVASDEEPVNWNSFLTAQGQYSGLAANQIEASSTVRPGSSGTKSARIWTRNAGFGVKANGNLTLGKINMESITPANEQNYNVSLTSDSNFSEELTDTPDSLMFWAKFTPISSGSQARVKATLHDNYDYHDPEDSTSSTHVVASAKLNYGTTSGVWKRFSIPFDYSGPATGNTHILVTFTTNMTPGGGDVGDEVFIDDVELIYNTIAIEEISNEDVRVFVNNTNNELIFDDRIQSGSYAVYNGLGQLIQSGNVAKSVAFEAKEGIYFVHLFTNEKNFTFEVFKN